MHRFYIQSPDISSKVITILDKRIVHQANKVLRMRKNDKLRIFDENENEYSVEIVDIDRKKILGSILESISNTAEPKLDVSLYQAIPKKPALFELIVQKATEIGVTHIYPLITERTERRRITKFERLLAIAIEASEQSGRTRIPIIHHPVALDNISSTITNAYVAYEYEKKKYLLDYGDKLFKNNKAQIIIGPEGGFSQKEIDILKQAKIKPFTFGDRILRTETASISALSLLLLTRQ